MADSPGTASLGPVLEDLFALLEQRKVEMPEDSYTTKLLSGDLDQLLKKIGEEATEVVMAAKDDDAGQLKYEIADLVYHLMVVMARADLTLDDLAEELESRRK